MNERKKSILFACYGLGIGGIEKCLVNLLNVLPEEEFDIDLLVMNPEYDMVPQIRRKVHFVDAFDYILNTEFTMQEIRRRGGLWKHREKLLPYIDHRIRIKLGLPLWTKFRPLEKHYDVAVAYSQNGLAPYYVIDKVDAARKVLWYHNGTYEKTGKEYALDQRYYHRFDYVVGVSPFCAELLREKFGFDDHKLIVLYNICDAKCIQENAQAGIAEHFSKEAIHITTVGRLVAEKGVDLALEACRMLCAEDRNICWHWVGDGNQAERVRKEIKRLGLQDRFLLEGNQTNPYPYIHNAAVYVQPSLYESYSMTTMEAKILHKPIVITDVGGMRVLLKHEENGLIVPPEAGEIAAAVRRLLDDPELRDRFSAALREENYASDAVLEPYRKSVFA